MSLDRGVVGVKEGCCASTCQAEGMENHCYFLVTEAEGVLVAMTGESNASWKAPCPVLEGTSLGSSLVRNHSQEFGLYFVGSE